MFRIVQTKTLHDDRDHPFKTSLNSIIYLPTQHRAQVSKHPGWLRNVEGAKGQERVMPKVARQHRLPQVRCVLSYTSHY